MGKSNLKSRLATAGIAIPVLTYIMYLGPAWAWFLVTLLGVAAAGWEAFGMTHPGDKVARGVGALQGVGLAAGVYFFGDDAKVLLTLLMASIDRAPRRGRRRRRSWASRRWRAPEPDVCAYRRRDEPAVRRSRPRAGARDGALLWRVFRLRRSISPTLDHGPDQPSSSCTFFHGFTKNLHSGCFV